jgi:hypothetical protein
LSHFHRLRFEAVSYGLLAAHQKERIGPIFEKAWFAAILSRAPRFAKATVV